MTDHHATLGVKRENTFTSTSCSLQPFSCPSPTEKRSPFLLLDPPVSTVAAGREGFDIDMDLAKFLGDPDMTTPTTTCSSNGMDGSEWSTLFTATDLEGLDVLDPSTGAPAGGGGVSNGLTDHPSFVPGLTPVTSSGFNGGHVELQQNNSNVTDSNWLVEQSQKLERQQQLQQQKLLELEQTLLRTEILKNRLEIVSNLKHASPELQSQLIGVLSTRSSSIGGVSTTHTQQSLTTPTSVAPRLVSRPQTSVPAPVVPHSTPQVVTPTSLPSPPDSELDDFTEYGPGGVVKKKSHNLIEKKYRTSINDRIGTLRDIVSKHFRDDKKVQKSAVLQKTIDYIRYLENSNRKLLEENRAFKTQLMKQAGSQTILTSGLSSNHSPLSWSDPSDDGHPSSPDVFLSDTSPTASPPLPLSPRYNSVLKLGGRIFMCFMLVMCFMVDPLSLIGGGGGGVASNGGVSHGSQRTLSSIESEGEEFNFSWCLVWCLRLFFAGLCFGWVWLQSLPVVNPEWEGVRYWRLRKQAEKDIKNGDFSSAQVHLVSALTEVGLSLPTSYTSLTLSLIWNGLSHVLFQLYVGQLLVGLVSFVFSKFNKVPSSQQKCLHIVKNADVAKTKHLLHQIILSGYDDRSMHGLGFYLGLTALNHGEVERESFSREEWAELLFVMGVQCQYSCACIATLLAHYYFLCAGNMSGLLSFINTADGWNYLMNKDWLTDVQSANKLYKGVAVFPKYSITRSYCKYLLTEAYQELLKPSEDTPSLMETEKVFKTVLGVTRRANGHLLEDMKLLIEDIPTLSDTALSRGCGFESLMWWASVGLVSCSWRSGTKGDDHYPIVEDISNGSGPIPSVVHLSFKAQRLYNHSSVAPPLTVINQLCSTASQALKICRQDLTSEDTLNLFGLFLALDWLLDLRYKVWKDNVNKEDTDPLLMNSIVKGYSTDIHVLNELTAHLPVAFTQLRRYKGYQRLITGGNPLLADTFLTPGTIHKRLVSS